MPSLGLLNGLTNGHQQYGANNGYNHLIATKFELPENLQKKILKIISSNWYDDEIKTIEIKTQNLRIKI